MATTVVQNLTEAILNKNSTNIKGLFERALYAKIHARLEEKREELSASLFGEASQKDESEEDSESGDDDNVEVMDGDDAAEDDNKNDD